MKPKILIATICNYDFIPVYFMESAIQLLLETRKEYKADLMRFSSCDINHMRNMSARFSLEKDYTHLFQLDVDMIYPADSIIKLMKHKKDFIVGSACQKKSPFLPTQYKEFRTVNLNTQENCVMPKGKKLIKIGATGVVGALIKTSVFEKVDFPYFLQSYLDANRIIGGDVAFCGKLKDAKIDMFLDPTVRYSHETKQFVKLK